MKLSIFTDGGARGNPGPAAIGVLILNEEKKEVYRYAEKIGETTNNVAEYTALIKALEQAKNIGGKELVCTSDSELMVKQLTGKYKVKNEELKKLFVHQLEIHQHQLECLQQMKELIVMCIFLPDK